MPTRENPRVAKTLELLKEMDFTKALKIHGSVMQENGNPDIIVCHRDRYDQPGQFFVVEMKTELGSLSSIQKRRLAEWFRSGATTIVSTDPHGVIELIKKRRGNWDPYQVYTEPIGDISK